MHIIFGHVSYWQIFILKILSYFKFKVFYLYIDAKSDVKKNAISQNLKNKSILPLPIEFEGKITSKAYSMFTNDSDEIGYKKNLKLMPDKILKKYCNLFSISELKVKKLRLMIQDFISSQQRSIAAKIGLWSNLHPSKKIVYISFKFSCFYLSDIGDNVLKVIIPIDISCFFLKKAKKVILLFFKVFNTKSSMKKDENLYQKNIDDLASKKVAFVTHQGLSYGAKNKNFLFEKSLYYSNNIDSSLNKNNILHLDYSNFPNPEENILWVCLNKIEINKSRVFFKTLLGCLKTFSLIKNWKTFLGWLFCIKKYNMFLKYNEIIKKFYNLKIALIDHDYLCPKTLILALEKNNIKTTATQDRFITTFYTSYINVMVNTYYAASDYTASFIKKSKYYDVEYLVPVGQYRSDYIPLYRKEAIPETISVAKKSGKKILIVLAAHSADNWFESYSEPYLNWSMQIKFLEDFIQLSKYLNNTFIVLRYKTLTWSTNKHFENILKKVNNCENIIISDSYEESFYSYKLCAHADLVIAKHTSLADECLTNEIPVLFHDYSHNMENIVLDIPGYLPSSLVCNNFEELQQKSKSALLLNSSQIKDEIKELYKKIYYVDKKRDIKTKIINNIENQLIQSKNLN